MPKRSRKREHAGAHPNAEYEGTNTWKVLDRGLQALEKNDDLHLRTHRRYVIGYLTQSIASMPDRRDAMAVWLSAFGGFPPVGYVLRDYFYGRWIRLYSLPEAKRYPDTKQELAVILMRHNLVASVVLGLGAPVIGWTPHWDGRPDQSLRRWRPLTRAPRWRGTAEDLENLDGAKFFERRLTWSVGACDAELRAKADDRIGPLTLFSPVLGNAVCVYDGGLDVFLSAPVLVASIRKLFPDWISTHPEGL